MGFSDFVNKAKELADQHDEQIDSAVDRAQQYTGAGDTTAAGADPAAEVPAGPPTDVPAESGEVPPQ